MHNPDAAREIRLVEYLLQYGTTITYELDWHHGSYKIIIFQDAKLCARNLVGRKTTLLILLPCGRLTNNILVLASVFPDD